MSLTFGRSLRLRARHEFTAVQARGRRVSTRHLVLLGSPNTLGRDRLGVIASRRLGGAVLRNRAKRRLREAFRHRDLETNPAIHVRSFDLVAIPRREVASLPFEVLQVEFRNALARMRSAG